MGQKGESTLHAFCENNEKKGDLIDVIKLLVENGASIKAKDTGGETAFDYICANYRNENLKIIEYMIENGFDIRSTGLDERTELTS